jgi:hypothetical protein
MMRNHQQLRTPDYSREQQNSNPACFLRLAAQNLQCTRPKAAKENDAAEFTYGAAPYTADLMGYQLTEDIALPYYQYPPVL